MSIRPTILFVGNYNRKDYLDLFHRCQTDLSFCFLEYASRNEVTSHEYKLYGKAIFWGDYKSAKDLLSKINPHKVVFFFIESYFHIILNLTCKELGITTYLMDHGIRDININLRFEHHLLNRTPPPSSFKLSSAKKLLQAGARIRARFFLMESAKELTVNNVSFFKLFHKTRSENNFIDTFNKIKSPLRTANTYIAFSPKTFEVHKHYDHLPENKRVHFIGIPTYDNLAGIKPAAIPKKQILFLDQGLVQRGFFGWNRSNYIKFISEFSFICAKYGFQLLVKLHPVQPRQEAQLWAAHQHVKLIDNEELAEALPETPLIIGFFSTYLLPLIAMTHTTVLTLENHPIGRLDVSKSFTEASVAHPVYTLEELGWALENIDQLHQQQLPNKARFTEEWMYKFDGKAGERLRNILLSDEL